MAMSLAGEIIDPLNGRSDIEARLLRECSDQSFLQDPIRIFRALRFETHGWKMTPECEALIQQQEWETSLAAITIERFSKEMLKSLQSKYPCIFFRRMVEFNVGKTFLPELFRMTEIPAGPTTYHPEGDLFTHSLEVLHRMSEMSPDLIPRFCALFHDLGKLATLPDLYPKQNSTSTQGSHGSHPSAPG
jgi:tRNA nucleotidyltransferase (CCA-adding enzyme)